MAAVTENEQLLLKRINKAIAEINKMAAVCKTYGDELAKRDQQIASLQDQLKKEQLKNQKLNETLNSWRTRLQSVLGNKD